MYNLTYLKSFNLFLVAGLISFSIQSAQVETYGSRAKLATNPVAHKLFNIMETKKTNLAVAPDITSKDAILQIVRAVAPEICLLKIHADTITGFDQPFIWELQILAKAHDFLILEDRKFADIGKVLKDQYTSDVHEIVKWADLVTMYVISGPTSIEALQQAATGRQRGAVVVAELSTEDNLIDEGLTNKSLKIANDSKFAAGIVAQKAMPEKHLIKMTPGVSILKTGDDLGQQYKSPEYVVKNLKSDVIIVGRGIYEAKDPRAAARQYREAGWKAYQESLAQQ